MTITIKEIEISEEELKLIKERIGTMPSNMRIAILGKVYSREDIIKEIEAETDVGKEFLIMEAEYYRYLIRD